jgi:hypothetical protein
LGREGNEDGKLKFKRYGKGSGNEIGKGNKKGNGTRMGNGNGIANVSQVEIRKKSYFFFKCIYPPVMPQILFVTFKQYGDIYLNKKYLSEIK